MSVGARLTGLGWTRLPSVAVAAALLCVCGCESSRNSGNSIVVAPASSTLVGGQGSVYLTATAATNATDDLFLPLEWSVTDPSLGTIVVQGGITAVYVGTGRIGTNAIKVKDRGKAEGSAVIYQPVTGTTIAATD